MGKLDLSAAYQNTILFATCPLAKMPFKDHCVRDIVVLCFPPEAIKVSEQQGQITARMPKGQLSLAKKNLLRTRLRLSPGGAIKKSKRTCCANDVERNILWHWL